MEDDKNEPIMYSPPDGKPIDIKLTQRHEQMMMPQIDVENADAIQIQHNTVPNTMGVTDRIIGDYDSLATPQHYNVDSNRLPFETHSNTETIGLPKTAHLKTVRMAGEAGELDDIFVNELADNMQMGASQPAQQ